MCNADVYLIKNGEWSREYNYGKCGYYEAR